MPGRGASLAFRRFGAAWIRIDLADRLSAHAHAAKQAGHGDVIDEPLVTSLGLDPATVEKLMAEVGFIPKGDAWTWRGNRRPGRRAESAPRPGNAFSALAELKRK